jgi:allantoicase
LIDLSSASMGGRVVSCNDEFFAEAANLLKTSAPKWDPEAFTDRGKWMDGWETRRRRDDGFDWCVLALGVPGRIRRVTVDTAHFTGNYPESFSLEACSAGPGFDPGRAEWVEIVGRTSLEGDSILDVEVDDPHRATHVRLNIYPDGGVGRLRIWGDPIPEMSQVCPADGSIDLVAAVVGGEALDASDHHYSPPSNLLAPTDPAGMWDGWETRRRRGPGHDWATFRLGLSGKIDLIEVDTRFFKGNAPGWVSVSVSDDGQEWIPIVERAAVEPDTINRVRPSAPMAASLVRLDIHPDGGLARLHILGRPNPEAAGELRVRYLNALFPEEAEKFFRAACASRNWVARMVSRRPYASPGGVLEAARDEFEGLRETDWLEAFAGHPRIGERGEEMANREQTGADGAEESILDGLVRVNRDYELRFGFTFIVYATGKSASEMLEIARRRLGNDRRSEIVNASVEQTAITETRLRRMLCMEA